MYAEVLIEIKNKKLDKTFTYQIPDNLKNTIEVGFLVTVPFGKKELEGYVLNIKNETDTENLKEIINLKKEENVLNQEMVELGYFLKEKTMTSLSACYTAMLPKALKAKKGSKVNKKYTSYLVLNEISNIKLTKAQESIINLFKDNKEILKKEANDKSISATKTLIKKGLIKEVPKEVSRYEITTKKTSLKKTLTPDQQLAYDKITSFLGQPKTILLHGVTGSGKTEVYLQVIEKVLESKKTALVLVPEISLTPQFVTRFNERFKNQIAVLHSHLSDGEKYDEWRKIVEEKTPIVIGARSAIFAPLKNIGLIIMDEEHSPSYKQENKPKYHALTIAKKRSETWNCPIILGSATPSLNTMARALKKVYEYIPMNQRANGNNLPLVKLVDMTSEAKTNHQIISKALEIAIIERLNRHEQVVLLLNRRGYSTVITCSNCGYTYKCPNCDISLTYHKSTKNIRCHYCGYTKYIDNLCPKCHEKSLNFYGLGTEKLESYLEEIFPTARVIRMDADSTQNKGKYEQITTDFYNHEYDILLGTQMVSKGLDFPGVTLVGIINADASLNIPDYRSNERTYSLLTQASGRSGRDKLAGEVIIQTYNPMHPILKFVSENSYQKFFNYEMKLRQTLKYPPFYFLAQVKLKSKKYDVLMKESQKVKSFLTQNLPKDNICLGPAPSSPFLINNVYNIEFLIKYKKDTLLIKCLTELDQIFLTSPDITLDIDISY